MITFKLIDENTCCPNGHTDFQNQNFSLTLSFKNCDEFYDFIDEDTDFERFMDEVECGTEDWCGVHDFCGSDEWVGYSSYEIKDFKSAIGKWEEFFRSKGKLA